MTRGEYFSPLSDYNEPLDIKLIPRQDRGEMPLNYEEPLEVELLPSQWRFIRAALGYYFIKVPENALQCCDLIALIAAQTENIIE